MYTGFFEYLKDNTSYLMALSRHRRRALNREELNAVYGFPFLYVHGESFSHLVGE
jgi:hypothetical protein